MKEIICSEIKKGDRVLIGERLMSSPVTHITPSKKTNGLVGFSILTEDGKIGAYMQHQEYPEFSEGSEIQEPSNKLEVLNREIKVIKKAIVETKRRIESRQKDLLIEVSKKIKEYAIRFGMTSLEEVELKTNPQLLLKKDGGKTTYTKCTNGERLRLKIASIIALISIAENQGIGRHPGLLLIDSPKREEITDKDVAQIVAGLEALTKELPYLQVF